jgi:hypothetical protein
MVSGPAFRSAAANVHHGNLDQKCSYALQAYQGYVRRMNGNVNHQRNVLIKISFVILMLTARTEAMKEQFAVGFSSLSLIS